MSDIEDDEKNELFKRVIKQAKEVERLEKIAVLCIELKFENTKLKEQLKECRKLLTN